MTTNEAKYKTLAELHTVSVAGLLPEGAHLTLDNDSNFMYDPETEELLYDDNLGYDIREQALDLLGIPWEHV